MAFSLKLRKLAKSGIEGQVRRAAAILGLEAILGRKPRELSGGQRQRVAVGRAIVRKPQVFLFDEPLSNLDAKLRVQTRKEISKLHQQLEATMIYVTHDQVEAMTLGDRIVVMHEGVVQQIDAPLDLYHRPANLFVAGFIGSPAMNLIPGHIRVGDGRTFEAWAGALRVRIDSRADGVPAGVAGPAGREVVLGVRPEDVQVDAVADRPDHGGAQLRLDLVEPMGNELFVYASRNDHEVVARVPPQPLPRPGSSISVRFDPAKLHLFDPLTEQRIDPRAS